jgi:hypothetical protein
MAINTGIECMTAGTNGDRVKPVWRPNLNLERKGEMEHSSTSFEESIEDAVASKRLPGLVLLAASKDGKRHPITAPDVGERLVWSAI